MKVQISSLQITLENVYNICIQEFCELLRLLYRHHSKWLQLLDNKYIHSLYAVTKYQCSGSMARQM